MTTTLISRHYLRRTARLAAHHYAQADPAHLYMVIRVRNDRRRWHVIRGTRPEHATATTTSTTAPATTPATTLSWKLTTPDPRRAA